MAERVAPDTGQPMLATDDDTFEGETAYDIGYRHGQENALHFPDRLPKNQRQAYSRGYARGRAQAVKTQNPTGYGGKVT